MLKIIISLIVTSLLFSSAGAGEYKHPFLRVPILKTAPKIDGIIGEKEWSGASAITGLASYSYKSMVPEIQQPVFYLAFDKKYLYIAMHSPHQQGTYPVAKIKGNDDKRVLYEDHIEIQILTHKRNEAAKPGKGFFKIMLNAKNAMIDQYLYNGTIGTEEMWSIGGSVKSLVTSKAWDMEMAIELERLGFNSLDGKSLVIQLVRTDSCLGMFFAGWVAEGWMSWNNFAEVLFDSNAPAFQLLKVGDIGSGKLESLIKIENNNPLIKKVSTTIQIKNASGQIIYNKNKAISFVDNQIKNVNFIQNKLLISKSNVLEKKKRNLFEIKSEYMVDGQKKSLYHIRTPFMQTDPGFIKKYVKPWLDKRPQSGDWQPKFAYLPYAEKAEISVDLDFFGMPEKICKAQNLSVSISKDSKGKQQLTVSTPIKNKKTKKILVNLSGLAEGDYLAKFNLTGKDGEDIIASKIIKFSRKKMEWEHNKLGISDEVIPPFIPIKVGTFSNVRLLSPRYKSAHPGREKIKVISVWGRNYKPGRNGLPEKIFIAPPTGNSGRVVNILKKPIKLELDGKDLNKSGQLTYDKISGAEVKFHGSGTLGKIKYKTKSIVEYDGWYEVELMIEPDGEPVLVNSLDLVVQLNNIPGAFPVDTFSVQRLGDGFLGNYFGKPPELFKSTDLLEYKDNYFDWKSFVPRTYIGSGDMGLWFLAWSASGWSLKEQQAMLTVKRHDNSDVTMKIRLLAGPVKIDKPRVLKFAFMTTPVKANNSRYRTVLEEGGFSHHTMGYRYYGDSVDGFNLKDRTSGADALRKFLLYGSRYQPEKSRWDNFSRLWKPLKWNGAKTIVYGSGRKTGVDNESFRQFQGEWLHDMFNESGASLKGRWNYQHTVQWNKPEQVVVYDINWTKSFNDFFLWSYKPLLGKAGINGTWWDNSSIFTIRQYNLQLKQMESQWGFYNRRALTKRLNVLGWQLMRPPAWISNMHVNTSWSQIFWMVENDWYCSSPNITSFEHWTLDGFRAMTRNKSTSLLCKPWFRGFRGTNSKKDKQIKRSLMAITLAHDIHQGAVNRKKRSALLDLQRKLRFFINISDTVNCLFTGYWRTEGYIIPKTKNIKASLYYNRFLKTAAILFFNPSRKTATLDGTSIDFKQITISKTPVVIERIFNIETDENINFTNKNGTIKITNSDIINISDFCLIGIRLK